ncbi:alpha-L-rhamnosidase-like protein [Mangrovibacterium diazotrophicum]|uniref:Alpha-L-rhamnosidase-like protein n=1 Tax=Mangrovibacterium diazotrophicum TaxID=1261403 RepID=A0A419W5W9_9BACT|nr:alpha-L-rhamnosidase-like protein [Mangrovibacterium diazotrophicum]
MKRRDFIKLTGSAGAVFCLLTPQSIKALTDGDYAGLENSFINPQRSVGPWVVWHWTSANQTKEGVISDLQGMAEAGIAGATLFSFPTGGMGSGGGTVIDNPAEPLTPEWFDLIDLAVNEADRLGLKLAIQISAGWATAGGDWIPPELSQQQVVWSETLIQGGQTYLGSLERPTRGEPIGGHGIAQPEIPDSWNNYYRDLHVLAFPVPQDWSKTSFTENAKITSNLPVTDFEKLGSPDNRSVVLKSEKEGYIQFEFENPFTLRAIKVESGSYNLPAHTMEIQQSNDGVTFATIGKLDAMLSGFQTQLTELTHVVPQSTAKFYRLVYTPKPPINYDEHMVGASFTSGGFGARPYGEPSGFVDLSKMVDDLSIASVCLLSQATVHHWEAKTAMTWGKSRRVANAEMPASACIPLDAIIDLTNEMQEDGTLNWKVPDGEWKIMRFGYTTMARTNGHGVGQGLESDKFSREGARIAFEGWYGRILDHVGPRMADSVVKMLNIDSWECGSQNWSPVFKEEFEKRRGYKVTKYLPLMTGIPVESAEVSEAFLYDIRRTIADLISDNFFDEMRTLAHAKGSLVNTEVTNPTMTSDGILAYKNVDETSSEFWCEKWNCWKPCDIRDAASGARVYGKQIVIAEAFTGGGDWREHPYDLKALGDMHYVDGVNRMMIHLWAAQPYPDRKPGATGATGLYFNQNTTWIKPGKVWLDYMRRVQALLQSGVATCDALYFIGEEIPARALIPPKYGSFFVTEPALPDGYDYDSINQDALLSRARVEENNIVLPNEVRYRVLVLHPDTKLTPQLARKIKALIAEGAQVVGPKPTGSITLEGGVQAHEEVLSIADEVWGDLDGVLRQERTYGLGRIFWGMPMVDVLDRMNLSPDVLFLNQTETLSGNPFRATANQPVGYNPTAYGEDRKGWGLMWNHRSNDGKDFYFLSNQEQMLISTEISIRQSGRIPEFWHPDSGQIEDVPLWREENGRTIIPHIFQPAESVFVMFRHSSAKTNQLVDIISPNQGAKTNLQIDVQASNINVWAKESGSWILEKKNGNQHEVKVNKIDTPVAVEGEWEVRFPLLTGEERVTELNLGSWTNSEDDEIKHFSGTATYHKTIDLDEALFRKNKRIFLDLGEVRNLARVKVNGQDLGVIWKPPYCIEMTTTAKPGLNIIEIEATNTWHNRLAYDAGLPKKERQTWVACGIRNGGIKKNAELVPAGILGPVKISSWIKAK